LFAKIEDEEIQKQIDKLEATKTANTAENKKNWFQKKPFNLRILPKWIFVTGTILEAEKNAEQNKLLILK
jgi:methionyl-tRNA synthetase